MPPTSNLSRRLSPNAHFKFSLQVMYLTLDPLTGYPVDHLLIAHVTAYRVVLTAATN